MMILLSLNELGDVLCDLCIRIMRNMTEKVWIVLWPNKHTAFCGIGAIIHSHIHGGINIGKNKK